MALCGSVSDLHALRRDIEGSARQVVGTAEAGTSRLLSSVVPMLTDLWPWVVRLIERRAGTVAQAAKPLRRGRRLAARGAGRVVGVVRQRPLLALAVVAGVTYLAVRQVRAMRH